MIRPLCLALALSAPKKSRVLPAKSSRPYPRQRRRTKQRTRQRAKKNLNLRAPRRYLRSNLSYRRRPQSLAATSVMTQRSKVRQRTKAEPENRLPSRFRFPRTAHHAFDHVLVTFKTESHWVFCAAIA